MQTGVSMRGKQRFNLSWSTPTLRGGPRGGTYKCHTSLHAGSLGQEESDVSSTCPGRGSDVLLHVCAQAISPHPSSHRETGAAPCAPAFLNPLLTS